MGYLLRSQLLEVFPAYHIIYQHLGYSGAILTKGMKPMLLGHRLKMIAAHYQFLCIWFPGRFFDSQPWVQSRWNPKVPYLEEGGFWHAFLRVIAKVVAKRRRSLDLDKTWSKTDIPRNWDFTSFGLKITTRESPLESKAGKIPIPVGGGGFLVPSFVEVQRPSYISKHMSNRAV